MESVSAQSASQIVESGGLRISVGDCSEAPTQNGVLQISPHVSTWEQYHGASTACRFAITIPDDQA
jgi:hypothetical protein